MNIIFKQDNSAENSGSLMQFGISNCYFKKLIFENDSKYATKKVHHHTFFEIHIITKGSQKYEINSQNYQINQGEFLLIPPTVPHKVIDNAPNTVKHSITFSFADGLFTDCIKSSLSERVMENIEFITAEYLHKKQISKVLIENSLLEIIVFILRYSGFKENNSTETVKENFILSLAIQYIKDNIENSPTISEVARYCSLSTRQLTRIFQSLENMSPGEFIKKERFQHIENLLCESMLTLREISEKMNFSSEYYFNTFFKKHSGIPPGDYRKTFGWNK